MRVLGADVSRERAGRREGVNTLVLLDDSGRVATVRPVASLPEVAAAVADLVEDEPFSLGVNLVLVQSPRVSRSRAVDNLARRRFGLRLGGTGRAAEKAGPTGEALLAALAAAGHACLAYPDRNRRESGLAEIHPELVVKALLWEKASFTRAGPAVRDEIFRAYPVPAYRASRARGRGGWAERAATLDLLMQCLGSPEGYDLQRSREALLAAASDEEVERAGSVFDATLLAATVRRYLEAPEACLFLGDAEKGYTILPADGFIRRLAAREGAPRRGRLFPKTSLQERLRDVADLKPLDLLPVPGRPQRLEAVFRALPLYEFDNVDEMLWWKHTRHLSGPHVPTEGLIELNVRLGVGDETDAAGRTMRLVRSRHRTLSFRFDPPGGWRTHVPTRDGKTYPFRVLRAAFEALPRTE